MDMSSVYFMVMRNGSKKQKELFLKMFITEVEAYTNKKIDIILNGEKTGEIVAIRVFIAKVLRAKGYKLTDVAVIMHKHHTSIIHYLEVYENMIKTHHEPLTKLLPIIDIVTPKVYEQSTA